MSKLWKPDNAGKVIPVVRVRPLLPPPPKVGVRLQPQHLHWQLGRYVEDLSFGPGGRGRRKRWVVDMEAEQHNVVLNNAYDNLIAQGGFRDLSQYAVVGTGSTPPDATQLGLTNEVRRTNRDQNGNTNAYSISIYTPGVYDVTRTREFLETEVGNLNLAEWGFSPSGSAGGNLMSRELFRDGNGNPIVITPASDQRLRLIYRYRVTMSPITPVAASIDISGIGVRTGLFVINRATDPNYGYQMWWNGMADLGLAHQIATGSASPSIYNAPARIWFTPDYTTPRSYGAQNWGQSYDAAFQPYTPGSRQRQVSSAVYASQQFNDTIVGFCLWQPGGGGSYIANAQFILNAGQEFAKTNLYKLTIGPWTLTWGP